MKHILFVDDEPNILDGLKRMLRPLRSGWEMSFATSGKDALALMAARPVDVLVTDMRMPEMDGATLMEKVRERYPAVIRLVLSGHFDQAAGLRAVPVAHQFLVKPCEPEALRSAVERAGELHALLADDATRAVVSEIGELPSPPRICEAVIAALGRPEVSLTEVGSILEEDVALSAKVLQLVNSAFFGISQTFVDVRLAVTYLGIDILKQLVFSTSVLRAFRPVEPIPGFSIEEFEVHSILTAEMAARLPAPKSLASMCAIGARLHDVGKLVLASRLPERFIAVVDRASRDQRPFWVVEEEIFGVTHAQIGAYLLGLWGLPAALVSAVAGHHRPPDPADSDNLLDFRSCIAVADDLAYALERRCPINPEAPQLDLAAIDAEVQGWRQSWEAVPAGGTT